MLRVLMLVRNHTESRVIRGGGLVPLCAGAIVFWPSAGWTQVSLPAANWAPPALELPAGAEGAPTAAPTSVDPGGPPQLGAPPRAGIMLAPGFASELPEGEMGRAYTISPSIAGQVQATDNINQTVTNKRSEFVTSISPALLVSVDTARLRGIVNFRPSVQIYGDDTSQSRVVPNFTGQALLTLVTDSVFVDIRGASATQAPSGGFASQSTPTINRQGLSQTTSFQISPYYVHRFGDVATMQVGYGFQAVDQQLGGGASSTVTPAGQPFFSNTNFVANSFFGSVRTGPSFGRLALEARVVSTDYSGNGVFDSAYRRIAVVEARQSLTREFAILGEIGYEMQRYSTVPVYELNEVIWAVGTRITLGQESAITLKYGHRDGVNSPSLNAVISLGGRTRVFASYSERLSSSAQRAADLLSNTTLDALGNPVDAQTGAPVLQPFADSFQGAQSSLQLVRQGTVTVSQSWPRDTIFLTAAAQRIIPVAAAPGNVTFAQSGYSTNLSWSHALTPATSAVGSLQYGWLERSGFSSTAVYGGSVSLVTQLTPGLSAFTQYGLIYRDVVTGGRAVQNTILVGLRQSF